MNREGAFILATVALIFAIALVFFLISRNRTSKGSVSIDASVKYQIIDGFGGSGAYFESLVFNLKEPKRTEVVNLLFSDLGINIYRMRAWTGIESSNDDEDPNHFNWDAFNLYTDMYQIWNAKQAKNRGVNKFIASVWSPPWWMKNNSRETNGGYLLPEMYEEFAEWLAAYVIGYKEHHGIEIGWISIQNEPDYVATWETCVYTPEQMRDLVKVVGAKFRALNISTKILIPETSGVSKVSQYIQVIMSDPEAAKYVDIFDFHLYDIKYFNPDESVTGLQTLAGYSSEYNRPIWETEYSYLEFDRAGTLDEALAEAQHIHNTLVYGNVSAYLVWTLFWIGNGLISIDPSIGEYRVNLVFYALKQYSKFITPGSRRIYTSSDNPSLLVSSYLNEESNRIAIVAINRGEYPMLASFNIKNISKTSLMQYRTSGSEKCAHVGDVEVSNGSFEVVLPPRSITTFTG